MHKEPILSEPTILSLAHLMQVYWVPSVQVAQV